MTSTPKPSQPRIPPDRKVIVWAYVRRCVEKQGKEARSSDALFLVDQQLRDATDAAGGQP